MAVPVGARRAAAQAVGWTVACAATAISIVYFAEIKDGARTILGLPKFSAPQHSGSPQIAVRTDYQPARGVYGRRVELQAGAHGHYYVEAEINGRRIGVMVDTGASQVALSYEDAMQAGIYVRDRDFTQQVRTANGIGRVAPVVLDSVSIGGITVRNVQASVSERGMLGTTLLGMSFLKRLSRVDMSGDTLVLHE